MGGLDSKPILAFCVSISSYSPVGFLIDTGWSASAADQDKLSVLILFQILHYSLPEGLEKCRINLVGGDDGAADGKYCQVHFFTPSHRLAHIFMDFGEKCGHFLKKLRS